jgi:hypothetical protein
MIHMPATKRILTGLACALGMLAAGAGAQPAATPAVPALVAKPAPKGAVKAADKPVWSQLSRTQQIALEPLHAEWDPMEGVRKQKWLEVANRYAAMKPEEQQRVQERMREWVRLTPDQRKAVRQNFAQAKTISPDEKSATWESYKQLPDDQKQKLAEQAKRKQLTNVPSAKSAHHSVTPVLHGAQACPAGSVRNTASATPACVAAAPSAAPAAVAAPGIVTSSAPAK